MSDRREEIIYPILKKPEYSYDDNIPIAAIKEAMDEYFTERALELLEYMAKNDVKCTWYEHEVLGIQYRFMHKGDDISKEQLFENFL